MRRHVLATAVLGWLVSGCMMDTAAEGSGSSGGGAGGGSSDGQVDPGTLTAADWDDNANFTFYQRYVAQFLEGNSAWPAAATDRVTVNIVDERGRPVPSAQVTVSNNTGASFSSRTSAQGRALLFPSRDLGGGGSFVVKAELQDGSVAPVTVTMATETDAWDVVLPSASVQRPGALDLAFMVDTTGSMGDEIEFLAREIQGISDAIRAQLPEVNVRYALVVYRDGPAGNAAAADNPLARVVGEVLGGMNAPMAEEYLVRTFDFTDSLDDFKSKVDAQEAGGGGDYPEAVEAGLEAMNGLSWRSGNVARLAFFIADAPPHHDRAQRTMDEIQRARLAGITVFPVAASGSSVHSEYVMRVAAQVTQGRFIFITDDSGVGGSHEEPSIPCYRVQKLQGIIIRNVVSEVSGARVEPGSEDILREVGNPVEGVCTLEDGSEAYL
ncbi:MAG: hypothetical protein AB2A00_30220 [Myxococcota bacterium]